MRKYYCRACKKEFEMEWWQVSTSWHPKVKKYMHVHYLACPYCNFRHDISFWKMPIKAKLRFIKEALSFQ